MSLPNDFVMDASVPLAWCFEDKSTAEAVALLERLEADTAWVPSVWPLEVGNWLSAAVQREWLSYAQMSRFLELIGGLPLQIDPETASRSFSHILPLAHRLALTTYAASYVELAARRGLPLATGDEALSRAATRAGVAVLRV